MAEVAILTLSSCANMDATIQNTLHKKEPAMKKLITFAAIIVALFVGLIIALSLSLNTVIKNGVETFGPQLTGTTVTLNKVSLNILSGSGEIAGVTIGNPPGFATDAAIRLDSVRIAIDPKSLLGDRIRIKTIRIDGPEITYETSMQGSNINKIMTNIQAATGKKNSEPNDTKSSGKQLRIDDLLIKNGTVRMSATILKGKSLDLPLPEIHLTDIGKEEKGASVGEVTRQVFGAVNKGVGKAVAKSGEILGKSAEAIKKTGQEAVESASEGVKSLFKGLGNAVSGEK